MAASSSYHWCRSEALLGGTSGKYIPSKQIDQNQIRIRRGLSPLDEKFNSQTTRQACPLDVKILRRIGEINLKSTNPNSFRARRSCEKSATINTRVSVRLCPERDSIGVGML